MLDASIKEIIYMPYTVLIDKAIPGTALSGNDATKLKNQVAAIAEGLPGGLKEGQRCGPFDFKDDKNIKRYFKFTVLKMEPKIIHIEITDFKTAT